MILDEAGLARQAALGEDSRHRFQGVELEERELACEMAALANSAGGEIFLGLAEDGSMPGLPGSVVARANRTLQRAARSLVPPLVVRTGNVLLQSGRIVIVVEVPLSRKLVLDDAGKAWVKVAAGRVAQAPDEACGHFQSFQSDGKASDKAGRESLVETREPSCDSDSEQDGRPEEKNFSSFDPESFEGREAREVYRLITNDKFVKKTLFQLDTTLEMLLPNVFKELSAEQLERYEQTRKKLIFLAMQPDAVKSDLSERFLVLLHGEGSKRITDKTQLTTLKQVTMSASVFQSLFEIELGINKKKDEKLNQKIAG